jgi:outer membrane receptor protein involved in Fe transport
MTPQDGAFGQYSLEYKHDFSAHFAVTATVSHRSHMANLTRDNYFYPFKVDNLVNDSTLYENALKLTEELRARWTPLDGHTFIFGYNAAQDWSKLHRVAGIDGADLETKKSSITNHGLYLQYEFEWDKRLFVTVGGRGDWFDCDLDAKFASPATVRQKTGFETFNSRGGIRYKFNDGFAVGGNIGRGFRAPDSVYVVGGVSRPFVEFLPNSALQPEKTDSFDFGIDVDTNFGLHAAATGFFNDITNYISVARYRQANNTIIQGQNLAKVQTYGAELELTQRITDAPSLFTNYTHTGIRRILASRLYI